MDVKASSFDADNIMHEVNQLVHEDVSDYRVKHLLSGDTPKKVDQKIYIKDYLMNFGVRLNINRDNYKVPPGLYKIGTPNENSEVVVTANYKLTFDKVRSQLNKDYWLLIIDSDGINVWCAAGKGRFGTAEIIYSILECDLKHIVSHKRIILPQLSGPGVQSQLITIKTGFKVCFGPVDIKDMDVFVAQDLVATENMRTIKFTLTDRIAVMPLEWVGVLKYLLAVLILTFILPYVGYEAVMLMVIGSITGSVIVPLILPIRPFPMFYINGVVIGLVGCGLYVLWADLNFLHVSLGILSSAYSGYLAMNFTGSTTFTSLSGVKKEMEQAIPVLSALAIVGTVMTVLFYILEVLS